MAGGSVVSAVVAIILLRQLSHLREQLRLTKEQITSGVQWNKLNAAFTYFNSETVLNRERSVAVALDRIGYNFYHEQRPLSADELDRIWSDDQVFAAIKDFLNLTEDYCTAVRVGAIDEDAGYGMMSGMIMKWSRVFQPFVERLRSESADSEAFCELELLSQKWRVREQQNQDAREATLTEARERIHADRGVQQKV